MRRVVIDTNVLLDCWVFDDAAALPLKTALEFGRVAAVRSAATDAELLDVLRRPQFDLPVATRDALVENWQRMAALIEVEAPASIRCADVTDQKFLDLAFAARAYALFTKDNELLAVAARARREGLHIATPDAAGSVLLFEDGVA